MADENQGQNDDEGEHDSLASKDMLSFSWQIAQGMVSKPYQLELLMIEFFDGAERLGIKSCDWKWNPADRVLAPTIGLKTQIFVSTEQFDFSPWLHLK